MKPLTKLLIVVVVGLVAVLALVLYLIRPSLRQVVRLNAELKEKTIESKTLEQQILAFKTAQSDLAKASQKDRINNTILSREELVVPIVDLEDAASATGSEHALMIEDDELKAKSSKAAAAEAAKPPKIPGTKEIKFNLSVKNNFEDFIRFMQLVEHSPYFVEITDLELSGEVLGSSSGSTQVISHTGIVIANLEGIFYVTKDETTTPKQ